MPTVSDIVVKKPGEEEIAECKTWPIWSCQESVFDWDYTQTETCLILKGKVIVKDRPGQNSVSFGHGDLVIFPVGLKCVWQVAEPVEKHYKFS